MRLIFFPALTCLCLISGYVPPAWGKPSHALTLFTEPKYKPGFDHFDYANPAAPKGGTVRLDYPASFDSLNPYILKGLPAPGLAYLFETLMTPSYDEPQSYYGLIAERVDLAADKTFVTFHLNPKARWQDGTPITPEDVIFSLNTLKEKGDPFFKLQYKPVPKAEKTGQYRVRFTLSDPENRDLPFIVAAMPVISRTYYTTHDFAKSSLEPPLVSGPYKIARVEAGRTITYQRDPDYWGRDLPVRKGHFNFDKIRYDVYLDDTVALEALKAHETDLHDEYIARNWATAYDIPAVRDGRLIKYTAKHKIPRGMQAFIFNTRKEKFADARVREAISLTMDFEWMNKTIFFGAYERNDSFFQNTDFAARELPSKEEIALLEPYRDSLPPEVFSKIYEPFTSDGSGNNRENLLKAQRLLDEAGWVIKDGIRVNQKTGEKLSIEFMMRQKTFERVVASMIRHLNRLGITATFRLVDDAQYQKRIEKNDFDLISIWWNQGLVFPGQEQMQFWHSSQADIPGSQNQSGLKDPLVDALLEKIVSARDYNSLKIPARALDRVLLWKHLIIPHWSISNFRVAFWDMFEHPKARPDYNLGFDTWWMKEQYR